jgi:hypothetical protein
MSLISRARACLWPLLVAGAVCVVAVWSVGARQDPKKNDPPAAVATPSATFEIVSGRVNHVFKPDGDRLHVITAPPGARLTTDNRTLRIDNTALLLRADADGRFTRISLEDIHKGGELDGFQASVAPRAPRGGVPQLVYWFAVLPNGTHRPLPIDIR